MDNKNNSKSEIDKNFLEIINLLNSNKIDYWLCHGTLLGIIRDKDLIPWDHDIDIAVWKEKGLKDKFKKLMKINNYELKKKYSIDDDLITFLKKGGREIDINFYEKKILNNMEIAFVRWFIPKNFFMKLIEAISEAKIYSGKAKWIVNKLSFCENFFNHLKKKLIINNQFYKQIGYTQPYKLLKKFKDINFKSIVVRVPYFSEEYLEYVYGDNWKQPVKEYNWVKDSPSTKNI